MALPACLHVTHNNAKYITFIYPMWGGKCIIKNSSKRHEFWNRKKTVHLVSMRMKSSPKRFDFQQLVNFFRNNNQMTQFTLLVTTSRSPILPNRWVEHPHSFVCVSLPFVLNKLEPDSAVYQKLCLNVCERVKTNREWRTIISNFHGNYCVLRASLRIDAEHKQYFVLVVRIMDDNMLRTLHFGQTKLKMCEWVRARSYQYQKHILYSTRIRSGAIFPVLVVVISFQSQFILYSIYSLRHTEIQTVWILLLLSTLVH